MKKKLVADRTSLIDASGIRKVFALAGDLKDPVNFSIGQPDFDVPEPLKREAIKAIEAGFNRYSQTAGEKDLMDRVAAQMKAEFGWQNSSVLVASGVSGGLLLAFMALINPGDEVIIPDPYFVIYKHVVNLLGGKCVFVDSYPDFRLPVDKIADAITDRTKLIILNSPGSSTRRARSRLWPRSRPRRTCSCSPTRFTSSSATTVRPRASRNTMITCSSCEDSARATP